MKSQSVSRTDRKHMGGSPAPPRRLVKQRNVWRCGGLWIPEPTMRQWMVIIISIGVVLLLGNMLSMQFLAHSRQNVATTLWEIARRPAVEPRGIVLPLFDGVAFLGISLIMEMRAMQIDLPIEVPHCGDLSERLRDRLTNDETLNVRVYDVCEKAALATEVGPLGNTRPLFCENVHHCHKRFRSFDIKVISLVFSKFQELMMLDADIMFMQNPTSLWDLDKFTTTGTLFFHDRISFTGQFLAERVSPKSQPDRSRLHVFVEEFDRSPFQRLATVPRSTGDTKDSVKNGQQHPAARQESLRHAGNHGKMQPSDLLKRSHSWNLRAGHEADSSLMLWSKTRQPRATAILGSFVTLHHAFRPPSYGDKELYFLACEVADAQYAFSDFGVGSIGWDLKPQQRALCGDALHYYPVKNPPIKDDEEVPVLYINSDHIATWNPEKEVLYRSKARRADQYPGSFAEKELAQECPFNVKSVRLAARELEIFRRRQRWYRIAESWQPKATVKPSDKEKTHDRVTLRPLEVPDNEG